ncbi:MAG TPA: hypothetical protein VNX65_03380 [Patescibacteria group bacterium]|jgi:hypothetical protein|nr:hypothetical protein [Patescibacteria group bacterium]
MRLKFIVGLALLCMIAINIAVSATPAHADVFGRHNGNNYYDGLFAPCSNFVFTPGGATPWDGITSDWKTVDITANSFITAISQRLYDGSWSVNRARAAATVNMMMGIPGTSSLYNGPSSSRWVNGVAVAQANFNVWKNLVLAYDQKGWVEWNAYQLTVGGEIDGLGSGSGSYDHTTHTCPGQVPDVVFKNLSATANPYLAKTVIFHVGGSSSKLFSIKNFCGNMIGTENPLTPPGVFYNITGHTTVQPTALPGDTVTFHNYLNKTGANPAPDIRWNERNPDDGSAINGNWYSFGSNDSGDIDVYDERYNIPPDAPFGKSYCRYIDFTPAVSGSGSGTGPTACVLVVPQYSLTPVVTANTQTAQPNDQITFTYTVNNSGPTSSLPTNCNIIGNLRPSGYPFPGYTPPPTGCPKTFGPGANALTTEVVTVGNLAPGTQICRSLEVDPKDQTGGTITSPEVCVVIAKGPYVHFMGADVWAGGGFSDPVTNPACNGTATIQTVTPHQLQSGSAAGSLTEYAGFAMGVITNFGSASKALLGSSGRSLLFSNENVDNQFGEFGAPQHCINNYTATYNSHPVDVPSLPSSIDVGAQTASGVWHLSGNRTFSGVMPAGVQQVYLVDGKVTITGDITYPAIYNSLSDIPSLVIIAQGTNASIDVMSNVGQMDGVFATTGVFHTCDNHIAPLTISICNKQLNVNGAVIASRLNLRRTFGADGADDTARQQPAERFTLNPELYLRSVFGGTNGATARTIEEKDLAPRY